MVREDGNFDVDDYMRNLTGAAYPATEELQENVRMFRRRWTLRVKQPLAAANVLRETVRKFETDAQREILRNYGIAAAGDLPRLTSARIDDYHLLLGIECPKPAVAVGDIAAVVTWMVLQAADMAWGIDDLEGIPRRYWFALK